VGDGHGLTSDRRVVAAHDRFLHLATDKDSVMSHWKKSFPGKYLQVSDLDTPLVATIASVTNENVGQGDNAELKPVVRFTESGVKAVVLNLTRAEAIEKHRW